MLLSCKQALICWRKVIRQEENGDKKEMLSQLTKIQDEDAKSMQDKDSMLHKEFQLKLEEEDLKWRQIAKVHWLKHRDKNTSFFHLNATQRRKTNRISQLLGPQGELVFDQT